MIKIPFYLIINSNKSVRTTKGKPDLNWNEICIYINLELPRELFQKPEFQANITIPESAAIKDPFPVEMINNIQDAIQAISGMEVKLTIAEPES